MAMACLRLFLSMMLFAGGVSAAKSEQSSYAALLPDWKVRSDFALFSPADRANWKFGFYTGILVIDTGFNQISATPWGASGKLDQNYITAANAVYKMVELPYLPMNLEIDLAAAWHSPDSFAEFTLTPTFRWKWFPWNQYVYTNVRVGPFGLSYATKIADYERMQVLNGHSTKLMNSTVVEWTFSTSENANWEVFYRIHHRCGIWGTWDGVVGGTSFLTLGFRASF